MYITYYISTGYEINKKKGQHHVTEASGEDESIADEGGMPVVEQLVAK